MEYVFSYGTLQDKSVQVALFKRVLKGVPDGLPGHKISLRKIYGHYPVVSKTNKPGSSVEGMVYELKPKELKIADAYEGEGYRRTNIVLESGKKAWVYLENGSQFIPNSNG